MRPDPRPADTRRQQQSAIMLSAATASTFLLVVLANYWLVIREFSVASARTGSDLATFWAEEGPDITMGFLTEIWGAWSRPLDSFRIDWFGTSLVLLVASAVIWLWWREGVLQSERSSPLWLSGCLLPLLIALLLFPYRMMQGAVAMARVGLTNGQILGAEAAESLMPAVLAAELGGLLFLVWIAGWSGWLQTFLPEAEDGE